MHSAMSATQSLKEDDVGPLLTLGDRVVWLFEHGPEHGWVRWIGRIPVVSPNWAIGVEFDNPIGAGDGKFGGKRYFYARNDHAYFLPNASLLRAADYNNRFRKENALRRPALGSRGKMYTFPHKYSAARCPFTTSDQGTDDFPAVVGHFCSSGKGAPHKAIPKMQRSQSSSLRDNSKLSDYENWLDKDPCNVHLQSWKSSSTHSVMSCPPVLLPRMLVAQEFTSSSESDTELGSLQSLMACFTLGPHRKKKRRKKKKSHRLVVASGRGNHCCPPSGSVHIPEKDCPSGQAQAKTSHCMPKPLWRFSLQEQDMMSKNVRETEMRQVATNRGREQKLPPKLPPKTVARKKRPAPQPPECSNISGSLPRMPVEQNAALDSSSLQSTDTASLTRRKSHKKPAPQPPKQESLCSSTKSNTLGNQIQLDACANQAVALNPHINMPVGTTSGTTSKSLPQQKQNIVVSMTNIGSNAYSLQTRPDGSLFDKNQEFGKNRIEMVTKPDLPVKTMPNCKRALHKPSTYLVKNIGSPSLKESNDKVTVTGKPSNESFELMPPSSSKTMLARSSVKNTPRNHGQEPHMGPSTLPKVRLCPPILEEEENYGAAAMIKGPQSLEAVLKHNSNVFELLDAFSKLELNSEDAQGNNDQGSPKQIKKQMKSLKSLFHKQPTDGSKVVSTKWTYTPIEGKKEKLLSNVKNKCAILEAVRKDNEIDNVTTEGGNLAATNQQAQTAQDFSLTKCRENLKPVSHLPNFGQVLSRLHPRETDDASLGKGRLLQEANVSLAMPAGVGGDNQEEELGLAGNSSSQGEKPSGRNLLKSTQAQSALPLDAVKVLPVASLAVSTESNSRSSTNRQRPPAHPNSPTAMMQAKLPGLFRQLEEAISKGEHDRAAVLARELALYKVSCSLRRVRKATPDSKQFTVKMYVEDKVSHVGPISLRVHPEMTLSNLKKKIEAEYNFPAKIQRWILGKTLATDDTSTLEQYGVGHSACPVFLYLVSSAASHCHEAEEHILLGSEQQEPPHSVASTEELETMSPPLARRTSNASNTLDALLNDQKAGWTCELCGIQNTEPDICAMCGAPMIPHTAARVYDEVANVDASVSEKGEEQAARALSPKDYVRLMELDEQDLVPSMEVFECSVCFLGVEPGEGVLLRDCLHMFCKDCLANAVRYSEEAMVKCPFRNDEYSCSSHLQEREIKALVSAEVYEHHLSRSVKTAESQAPNSYHCKTADCPGWCVLEDNVNIFMCPVCGHSNCLTCRAIHEGKNCLQYQDELDYNAPNGHEAKQTKDYLDNMVKEGQAMHCPQCQVIVMKKWGCDWLKCSVCQMEICWVTKGPRWGPNGKGDTSAGCKCGVNGVKCHPKCNYCH